MFERVSPAIRFLGVAAGESPTREYFLDEPLRLLAKYGCSKVIILYSYLSGAHVADTRLAGSLKFDEYKYAIAGVPFDQKWHLELARDEKREQALFDRLELDGEYICVHDTGSDVSHDILFPQDNDRDLTVVRISELTDDLFDWLLTLERASKLVLMDSCFANIVEQLNLPNEKILVLRSPVGFTPVYKNGWRFRFISAQ